MTNDILRLIVIFLALVDLGFLIAVLVYATPGIEEF